MYNNFKLIEKEFKIDDFRNKDKITKAIEKKLSYNSLNIHEKNIIAFNHSHWMLVYNTTESNIVSYYIVEFDINEIRDILKVNICREVNGYKIHSVKSKKSDSKKEDYYLSCINKIVNEDLFFMENDDIGYFDHHELAELINPRYNNQKYFS